MENQINRKVWSVSPEIGSGVCLHRREGVRHPTTPVRKNGYPKLTMWNKMAFIFILKIFQKNNQYEKECKLNLKKKLKKGGKEEEEKDKKKNYKKRTWPRIKA